MYQLRLVLAFVFAPISMGLLAALVSPPLGAWAIGLAAIIGYPVALTIGVPSYLLCRKKGWNGLWPYFAFSTICSATLILFLVVGPALSEGGSLVDLASPPRVGQMGLATFVSTSSVLIFWLIARPDRSPTIEARKEQT